MNDSDATFQSVKNRIDEIVDEVSNEDISLDDALALYEEAIKLGLSACELSESNIFPEEIEEEGGNACAESGEAPVQTKGAGAYDDISSSADSSQMTDEADSDEYAHS